MRIPGDEDEDDDGDYYDDYNIDEVIRSGAILAAVRTAEGGFDNFWRRVGNRLWTPEMEKIIRTSTGQMFDRMLQTKEIASSLASFDPQEQDRYKRVARPVFVDKFVERTRELWWNRLSAMN